MSSWETIPLSEIADVITSNVDKKSRDNELPVQLCNYMDVYSHEYINPNIDFMIATATNQEVRKFGLKKNDVLITKDSESPFDIGVPSILRTDIPNLLSGYHLSIIRTKNDLVFPDFLAFYFNHGRTKSYFSQRATGSTRFGLKQSTIENLPVSYPKDANIQKKICEVLLLLDNQIEETEKLIAKQELIREGLMQDLFTRGVDENGELRPSYERRQSSTMKRNWDGYQKDGTAMNFPNLQTYR